MKKLDRRSVFLIITIVWTVFAAMLTPLRFSRTCVGIVLPFPIPIHYQYIQRIHYGQVSAYTNKSAVAVEVTNTYTTKTETGTFLIQEGTISPSTEVEDIYGAVFGIKNYCVRLFGGVPSRETNRDMFPEGTTEFTYEFYNEQEGYLFKSDAYLFDITDNIWNKGSDLRGGAEVDIISIFYFLLLAGIECFIILSLTIGHNHHRYSLQVKNLIASIRSEYATEILEHGRKRYFHYIHTIQNCYFCALTVLSVMSFAVVNVITTSYKVFGILNVLFLLALLLCIAISLCARRKFLCQLELYDLLYITEYSSDHYLLQTGTISYFDKLLELCRLMLLDGHPESALEILNTAQSTMHSKLDKQRFDTQFLLFVLALFLRTGHSSELLSVLYHTGTFTPNSVLRKLGFRHPEQRQALALLDAYRSQNWETILSLTSHLPPLDRRTVSLWLMRYYAALNLHRVDILDEVSDQMGVCPKLLTWLNVERS